MAHLLAKVALLDRAGGWRTYFCGVVSHEPARPQQLLHCSLCAVMESLNEVEPGRLVVYILRGFAIKGELIIMSSNLHGFRTRAKHSAYCQLPH